MPLPSEEKNHDAMCLSGSPSSPSSCPPDFKPPAPPITYTPQVRVAFPSDIKKTVGFNLKPK